MIEDSLRISLCKLCDLLCIETFTCYMPYDPLCKSLVTERSHYGIYEDIDSLLDHETRGKCDMEGIIVFHELVENVREKVLS